MTHPDHLPRVQRIGTLAGLSVEILTLDAAERPWLPHALQALNATTTWVRIGAGSWVYSYRPARVRRWLDPEGSPWGVDDLVALLVECEIPDPTEGDWLEGCAGPTGSCEHPDHWRSHLPAARLTASTRYAQQALGLE